MPWSNQGMAGAAGAVSSGVSAATGNPVLGNLVTLPAGPVINRVNLGKGEKAKQVITKLIADAKKRKGHFGESFWHGASQWAPSGAIIGGLAGAALGGYLGYRNNNATDAWGTAAEGLGAGVIGGGLLSGLGGGAASAASDAVLGQTSDQTNKRVTDHLANNPSVTGLPLGSIIGAGVA
jgi:hypothetical protein